MTKPQTKKQHEKAAQGQNLRERYKHDVCPKCGTPSVPCEKVPDQALRGCPNCGHTWFEDLDKAPTEAPQIEQEPWYDAAEEAEVRAKIAPSIEEDATLEQMIAKHKAYGLTVAEHQAQDDDGKISRQDWRELALSRYATMEEYRTSAEKLAEALRDLLPYAEAYGPSSLATLERSREALAQWEGQ